MDVIKIEKEVLDMVVSAMSKSEMLKGLSENMLTQIAQRAELLNIPAGEVVIREGEPSDTFYLIIKGEVAVMHSKEDSAEEIELGRLTPPMTLGEIGLLLEHERTASIHTSEPTMLLKFDRSIFNYLFDNMPQFGLAISTFLAQRVHQLSSKISLPHHDESEGKPDPEVLKLLPTDLLIRHRILPLKVQDRRLYLGFVDDPTPAVMGTLHRLLPGRELRLVRVKPETFNEVLKAHAGVDEWAEDQKTEVVAIPVKEETAGSPRLDALLKRLVTEGASDLHLPAGQIPYWRIDGELRPLEDAKIVGATEVLELMEPVMHDRALEEFQEKKDADYSYTIAGSGRFRINIFQSDNGISAAIRVIPAALMTLEQLGLPPVIKKLCEMPKGLVLVTGPSGSGKSTTLAAMIDYINRNRRAHIITLEDPIEFVHRSNKSLITQRELGTSVLGFSRGLRSALREDPDIVLLGEMRDVETMALALEIANTGHLVFATLHTSTAVGTINRIIDAFPPEQQDQVRNDLSEVLRGVLCQTLCKRQGGGRVAAFELLVVSGPIGNMIREEKIIQIPNMMQTGRAQGHMFMNEALCALVNNRTVSFDEALSKSIDKDDLKRRVTPGEDPDAGKL